MLAFWSWCVNELTDPQLSSFQGWNRYELEDPSAARPAQPENCQWKSPFLPCQPGLGKSSKLFKIPRQFWEVTVTNLCNWSIFRGFATPTLLHRWELKGRRTLQGCVFLKEKWSSASWSSTSLIINLFSWERGALKMSVNKQQFKSCCNFPDFIFYSLLCQAVSEKFRLEMVSQVSFIYS